MLSLVGNCFNSLEVIKREKNSKAGKTRWLCQCACGKRVVCVGSDIKNGHTKSCGCAKKVSGPINATIHGHAKGGITTPEYHSWTCMKTRCLNKNDPAYPDYGGRGITICERWLNSFANFIADMGLKPYPKRRYSIDRINVNGNYELINCRWATWEQQESNRRPFSRKRKRI